MIFLPFTLLNADTSLVKRLHAMRLTCELRVDPRGVDALQPRLSWVLESAQRGQTQTAYRVWVADSPQKLAHDQGNLWDSGVIKSAQSVQVRYNGAALTSGRTCYWKVRVWDRDGQPSPDSAVHFWQMGLLHPSDWQGQWIGAGTPRDTLHDGETLPPCPYLRKTLTVDKAIAQATLYATARGVYELHLNGRRVGDEALAPGWTDYRKRIAYQTYDVTPLLHKGENVLGALLGDGWYSGYVGFGHHRDHYGNHPQLLAQLNIEYTDGARQAVVTDGSWKTAVGPLIYSDMLMGESYDARQEQPGWDKPRFRDEAWQPVRVEPGAATDVPLVGRHDPPIRVTDELKPQKMTEPAPGTYIFDIGQNMVGWARLQVQGKAGTQIRLRFAEMLNPDGALYTTNLRSAKQTDTYELKGKGTETFEPHFTFHGFRYVEMTGFPGKPPLNAITGCVVGSDAPPAGTFECSSAMVNQLQRNIVWGQRGNFLSIPTDCPQRDERLGWMGDAQIFVRTATYNRDVSAFFEKWIQDVEDAQSTEGGFPDVAPRLVDESDGAPAWGDAGIIVPWTIYQVYGDTGLLEKHWTAMTRWMDYLTRANPEGLWLHRRNNDFGDWLSIAADTPKDVLATAYYAYDAALMAQMARALGKDEEAGKYDALFGHIKDAFNTAYVTPDGRIQGDTQTCYVLALRFNLLPDNLRPRAAQHLVEDIAAKGGHLSTGFVGVGYLCPTLSDTGHNDVAYQLLLNDTFPSWGYSIKQGATTIWERWDGWTEEKGFQTPSMNSFNHYSLGSVGEWLYRYVAGIDTDPAHPGFAHILIRPHPDPRLTFARAEYDSIRGKISSSWHTQDGAVTLDVTIPANTTATVFLPAPENAAVTESGRPADQAEGVAFQRQEAGIRVYEIGSGAYHFTVR